MRSRTRPGEPTQTSASTTSFAASAAAAAAALVEALWAVRPDVPKLRIWDIEPTRHPIMVRTAASAAGIRLDFLLFRSAALMPLEERWRGRKQAIAANRCYAAQEELVERAPAWLAAIPDPSRRCRLDSSKFDWLPTQCGGLLTGPWRSQPTSLRSPAGQWPPSVLQYPEALSEPEGIGEQSRSYGVDRD